MAEFAAIPDGVLLMGEEDGMHPCDARFDGEIFPALDLGFLDRDTFDEIDRLHDPGGLGRLPVNAIVRFGKLCGVRPVLVFPDAVLAQGMTAVTLLSTRPIRAGGEERFASEELLSVMTSSAMEALAVAVCADSGAFCRHGKADVNVAEAAGELGAVQPMIEDYSSGT